MEHSSQFRQTFDRSIRTRAFVLGEDDLFAANATAFVDLVDEDIHRHDLVRESAFGDGSQCLAV